MIWCVEHDLEFRRLPSQKRAVVKMRVVERAGTEDRARPPVREVVRQVLERDADDLLGDEAEVVTGHHLGVIERLGERKLLVRVADAVAPDKLELLDQHAAFRVEHPLLGHDELTSISEAALPQGGGSKAARFACREPAHLVLLIQQAYIWTCRPRGTAYATEEPSKLPPRLNTSRAAPPLTSLSPTLRRSPRNGRRRISAPASASRASATTWTKLTNGLFPPVLPTNDSCR